MVECCSDTPGADRKIGVAGFCSPDEDSGKLALVLSGSEIRSGQVSVESLWLLLPR